MSFIKKKFGQYKAKVSSGYGSYKSKQYNKGLSGLNSKNVKSMKNKINEDNYISVMKRNNISNKYLKEQINYNKKKSRVATANRTTSAIKNFSNAFRR